MGGIRTTQNWNRNGWKQKLYQMWFIDGLSGGQIARHFGVSRGAVLGKLHREGWTGGRGKGKVRQQSKGTLSIGGGCRQKGLPTFAWRSSRGLPKLPAGRLQTDIKVLPSDPSVSERVAFVDLKAHQCRWPFEGGTFCGRESIGLGEPYCADHDARAHRPRVE